MTCDLVLTHRTFWACVSIRFHEIKAIISEFLTGGFITVRSRHFGRGGNFPVMVWSLSPVSLLSHPRGFPEPRALSCGACFLCQPPFPPPLTSYPLDPLFPSCTRCPWGLSPQLRTPFSVKFQLIGAQHQYWPAGQLPSTCPHLLHQTRRPRRAGVWLVCFGSATVPPPTAVYNASISGLFLIFSVIRWSQRKETTPTY